MTDPKSFMGEYRVVCICGGHGFPYGTATAARITLIGRALQSCGMSFRLLHCGPSPLAINVKRSGVHEGIQFQYTTTTRRPRNRLIRLLVYFWAVTELTFRLTLLWPSRRTTAIYLYLMNGPVVLYIGLLCRCLGIPVVQELCEWLPGDLRCSTFTRWLHKKAMFQLATGTLVISKAIEKRVHECCKAHNLDIQVLRVPALIDPSSFLPVLSSEEPNGSDVPEFLYCGTWTNDIYFLIRAFRLVLESGHECRLRMLIGTKAKQIPSILAYASEQGVDSHRLILMGYVDVSVLGTLYRSATALLMPLWKDDRSITRLPNKMSEYLASGRPIITSEVGDSIDLLADNVSAYIAQPADERSFANKMTATLTNPMQAAQIGAAGQKICLSHLDFRQYSDSLSSFFVSCIDRDRKRKTLSALSQS